MGRQYSILVAENEGIAGADIPYRLGRMGYGQVETVPGDEVLMEKILTAPPDLVLMAVFRQGGTASIDIARQVRKQVRAIFITSAEDRDYLEASGLADTPFGVLTLPVNDRALERAVDAAFYRREVRERIGRNELRCKIMGDGVGEWEFWRQPDGRFAYVSDSVRKVTGHAPEKFLEAPESLTEILHPEDRETVQGYFRKRPPDDPAMTRMEVRLLSPDSDYRWIALKCCPVFRPDGTWLGWRGSGRDITEFKEMQKTVARLADRDMLTGLPSRESLFSQLSRWLADEELKQKSVGLLCLDLDNFQHVNRRFGYPFGDEVLRETASRLRDCLRPDDTVCRIVENEFFVLLGDIPGEWYAGAAADKVIRTVGTPICSDGRYCRVTVSIGISIYPADGTDADTLVRKADIAMFRAKQQGKNNYLFYESSGGRDSEK